MSARKPSESCSVEQRDIAHHRSGQHFHASGKRTGLRVDLPEDARDPAPDLPLYGVDREVEKSSDLYQLDLFEHVF